MDDEGVRAEVRLTDACEHMIILRRGADIAVFKSKPSDILGRGEYYSPPGSKH